MVPRWLMPSMSPPVFLFLFLFQNIIETLKCNNFYSTSPNELILFAFCSYWKILAAHPRWDFSFLPRISGNFQKCSWYFLFVIWFIFRRWSLSWRHPGGVWSSSALRQATTTWSWCLCNIHDFLLEFIWYSLHIVLKINDDCAI